MASLTYGTFTLFNPFISLPVNNMSQLTYSRAETVTDMEARRIVNHILSGRPVKFVKETIIDLAPPRIKRHPRGCHTGITTMLHNTVMKLSNMISVDGRRRLYFETCEDVGVPKYKPFEWWIDLESLNYVWIATHELEDDKYYVEQITDPTEFIDLLDNDSWIEPRD